MIIKTRKEKKQNNFRRGKIDQIIQSLSEYEASEKVIMTDKLCKRKKKKKINLSSMITVMIN